MPKLTPKQVLLLKAALFKGNDAQTAWNEWKSVESLDFIDEESYVLLPQVYKNLLSRGIESRELNKLKGIYRHTWCKNTILIEQVIPLLQRLKEVGIPTLILNRASLITAYANDIGLMPLTRVDIAIQKEHSGEVVKWFHQLGWSSWEMEPEKTLSTRGRILLKGAKGEFCQIHSQILETYINPRADQYFWKHVSQSQWSNFTISNLNPNAYLLKSVIDGAESDSGISPIWVTEVYRLLSLTQPKVDWEEVLDQVQRLSLTIPFKRHVQQAVDVVDLHLSPDLFKYIENLSSTKLEELEYAAKVSRCSNEGGLLSRLSIHWCHYGRTESEGGRIQRILGFMGYLQKSWHLKHLWQMPLYGLLRSVRRIIREGFV